MHDWYFNYNKRRYGPFDLVKSRRLAKRKPDGLCWREGFVEWLPISQVPELNTSKSSELHEPPSPDQRTTDDVDFHIFGEEMQYVEIELDPGETVVAEAGAMMYKDPSVSMHAIFGDGSDDGESRKVSDMLLGAGKRLLTGERLFMTAFRHEGYGTKAKVAFASPYPGTIVPLTLANFDNKIICQKNSFLCAAKGVQIGIQFQRKILTGLLGGEGFIMQKLEGDGLVFMHTGGAIYERKLQAGETLHVDTGCLVAMTRDTDFDVEYVGGITSMFFGGEGIYFAKVQGPGTVWLQSQPFSRVAARIHAANPGIGGASVGEGSILGGVGRVLSGR